MAKNQPIRMFGETLPRVEAEETDVYFAVREAYIGYLEAAIDSVAHTLEGA